MPLYEYQCDACGHRFELIQKFSDPPPDTCTSCGKGPVHRMFSSPAIQFKGSGFYITDYAQKGKSDGAAAGAKAEKGDKSEKGDAKADTRSDSKSDTKTETKSDTKSETKADAKS